MVDSFFSADIANVNHSLDSFGNLNKSPELGETNYRPLDYSPQRKFSRSIRPRIAQSLLQPQRDSLFAEIDSEDHGFYRLARFYQIAGLAHSLDPRHLRNVDQSFNSWLQFHECPVISDASYCAAHPITDMEPG